MEESESRMTASQSGSRNGRPGRQMWKRGLLTGYISGIATAAVAAFVILAFSGAFGQKTRLRGRTIEMVERQESCKVSQGFADIPERYSLVNDNGKTVYVPIYQEVEKCSYDWDNLATISNYKYYAPDGQKQCRIGIDVSKYQTQADWNKVKESGVQFVMIRVGYRGYGKSGKIVPDEMFENHIRGAQAAGLDVGVYFFSQAVTEKEAREEADYVLEQIKDYNITYPVAFDSEKVETDDGRANSLTVEERTAVASAFLDTIKKGGYEPMVYANDRWFALSLDLRQLTDYKIWLASYRDRPVFPYAMDIWQHTNKATVPGVSGQVDMNIWFTDK